MNETFHCGPEEPVAHKLEEFKSSAHQRVRRRRSAGRGDTTFLSPAGEELGRGEAWGVTAATLGAATPVGGCVWKQALEQGWRRLQAAKLSLFFPVIMSPRAR